jgi:hypothetical protein
MKTHNARLAALQQRGWDCKHPDYAHNPVANDGEHHRAVYLEGLIHGVPQSIFLSIGTGLVMVLRGDDYAFDMFLQYVDSQPPRVQVAKEQRGLFGEDDE